jgi:hypothetical protein
VSVSAALITFLSGSAIGSLATAAVTTSHARAERFRDRMLDTAERFLTDGDQTAAALWQFELAASELLNARNDAIIKAETAHQRMLESIEAWTASDRSDEEIPESYSVALRALAGLEYDAALADPSQAAARAEAERAASRAAGAVQGLLDHEGATALAPIAQTLRAILRAHTRFMTALQSMGDAGAAVRDAVFRLHSSSARVVLLFHGKEGSGSIVAHAEQVKTELLAATDATTQAMNKLEPAIAYEPAIRHRQAANTATADFAAAVNARIRRRWKV